MTVKFGDSRLPDRYWDKVDVQPSGCWEWVGARSSSQYGQLRVSGKALLAHRMLCELEYGPSPEGKPFSLHTCDNPPCVNPKHLRWGSPKDNMQDRKDRGRENYPEKWSKTHCPRGHEYLKENTYVTKSGGRSCRECYRAHWRKWNKRRKDPDYKPNRVAQHGTGAEYNWGCRCQKCKDFKASEARKRRARKKREGERND